MFDKDTHLIAEAYLLKENLNTPPEELVGKIITANKDIEHVAIISGHEARSANFFKGQQLKIIDYKNGWLYGKMIQKGIGKHSPGLSGKTINDTRLHKMDEIVFGVHYPTSSDWNTAPILEAYENKENDSLFEKLVPGSGPAETVEGELLRAINKIGYRYYNDGDYFFQEYGIETAGSAYIYLTKHGGIVPGLVPLIMDAIGKYKQNYEQVINKAVDLITNYIVSKNGQYTKNSDDMQNYYDDAIAKFGEPYEDEEDSDEDYDDEDHPTERYGR